MKSWIAIGIVISACITSALGGFWFGFREGWNFSALSVSSAQGVIALRHIADLRAGKQDVVIQDLEMDINQGLYQTFKLERYSWRGLIPYIWDLGCISCNKYCNKYVVKLADYRAEHPSPLKPDIFSNVREMESSARDMTQDIDTEVQRHVSKH